MAALTPMQALETFIAYRENSQNLEVAFEDVYPLVLRVLRDQEKRIEALEESSNA